MFDRIIAGEPAFIIEETVGSILSERYPELNVFINKIPEDSPETILGGGRANLLLEDVSGKEEEKYYRAFRENYLDVLHMPSQEFA